jgi:uncharacterized protein (DUF2252 family)
MAEAAAPHPSPEERTAHGRAAREACPRRSHAGFEPTGRDAIGLLEEQAKTRIPELVPIRYGRMLVSPFAFYRGTTTVMAHDFAPLPRSGLDAQLCGDAHLGNFGGFGSPERDLVFDLNDFDETLPGPFEWDVKRLAVSVEIAGRGQELGASACRTAVVAMVHAYREAMRTFAQLGNLDVWYARVSVDGLVEKLSQERQEDEASTVARAGAKARTRDHLKAFKKLTTTVGGQPRIRSDPPLIVPIGEMLDGIADREAIEALVGSILAGFRSTLQPDRRLLLDSYEVVDVAHKVVGVSSVGTRCWIVLLIGRDKSDPLFVQVKEAQASVLEPFLGASGFATHGQRVVEGQRLMQATGDLFLGWHRTTELDGSERDYFCRQLWDWKGSANLDTLDADTLGPYGQLCGWTLARAHARSGDRIAIAEYLGQSDTFDESLASFATAYADQNERDYEAFRQAAADGRIEVVENL